MREQLGRIVEHARTPTAPPAGEVDRFWYGLAQPLYGLRVLWSTPALRRRALPPVLAVLVIAGFAALDVRHPTPGRIAWRYYAAVTGMASLPAVLFANTYARLAADAAAQLGFGERAPILSSLVARLRQMLHSVILVALGLLPLVVLLRMVPLAGDLAVLAVSSAWTMHWIVVEALDAARVVDPGRGAPPEPWFVAWTRSPLWDQVPGLRRPVRWFGRVITRLARPWAEEAALVARHPALAIGFGVAAAILLALPVANLLLRPAILVGAINLRGRLAKIDQNQG